MKIFLGADHGGFEMKEEIKVWLQAEGYEVEDCGNAQMDANDDYPEYAFVAAEKVVQSTIPSYGILFCRSGGGMVIAANKVKGVRAVDVFDMTSAIHARTNNDANVISLGADWMDPREARLIIQNFLQTEYLGEERHARRIEKITEYENK